MAIITSFIAGFFACLAPQSGAVPSPRLFNLGDSWNKPFSQYEKTLGKANRSTPYHPKTPSAPEASRSYTVPSSLRPLISGIALVGGTTPKTKDIVRHFTVFFSPSNAEPSLSDLLAAIGARAVSPDLLPIGKTAKNFYVRQVVTGKLRSAQIVKGAGGYEAKGGNFTVWLRRGEQGWLQIDALELSPSR